MTSSSVVPRPLLRSAARIACSVLLAGFAAACSAVGSAGAGSASNPDAMGWSELFNGGTLAGWISKFAKHDVAEKFANTFTVKDGIIEARSDGYGGDYNVQFGHLYYEKPYSYYLLSMEYRFVGELYPKAPSYTNRSSSNPPHPAQSGAQEPKNNPPPQKNTLV